MTGWGTTVSTRVIQKVADRSDRDPLELPPLYESIDPDALDALMQRMSSGAVSFEFAGYDVTVHTDGSIQLDKRLTENNTSREATCDD